VRPDVLISHLENVRITAAAARGHGVPMVVVMHNSHRQTLADLEFAAPALTVANSQWMALRIPRDCLVVRPPVDPVLYTATPGSAVTLINLTAGKGGHLFWTIARKMPGTEFLGVEGAYGEQVIPVQGLPNVTVLDAMDGRLMRDEVYARTRILLVPSDYESWGRAATEAMCSGIPVIAHRAEGALAENLGDAAIWADRHDPEAWVEQIRRLASPAAWEAASEAARKRSAELDPAGELERWCEAVEALKP
jgi:Glycosyl transferases group 1